MEGGKQDIEVDVEEEVSRSLYVVKLGRIG
jgi:hypothetical protein